MLPPDHLLPAFLPPTTLPLHRRPPRLSTHRTRPGFRLPRAALSPPKTATTPLQNYIHTPYPEPITPPVPIQQHPNITSFVHELAEKIPDLPALTDEHHTPVTRLTYRELSDNIKRVSSSLRALGLTQGSPVAFFSENSARWCVMDHAIMACGARAAVRGVSAPVQELAYIYKHSGSVALVAEDKNVVERLIASGLEREKIRYVILLYQRDSDVDDVSKLVPGVKVHTFESLLESGDKDRKDGWTPIGNRTDIATILYTSGTTGNPKGVPLTHGNILAQLEDISLGSHDPVPGEVFLSVLPCWHVFERTAAYWTMSKGMHVIYSNKRRFREDLVEHRPQMLISVPRVFENLHAVIMTKLRSASATRRKLFSLFMAISMAFILARRKARGIELRGGTVGNIFAAMQMMLLMPFYALANLLVWKKIRAGLGGKLKIALSGGGSIAGYLEDFFECAGIDICVGYGLTETSPVIANRFGQRNVRGSTGMQLPRSFIKVVDRNTGKRVKRGEQGKLFVTGPYVFDGYLNNPSATREAFDDEGYFDTGDLVYLDEGGDIVISGRSKDLIVLSNGENIEPAPIEDALCSSDLIDQVMLVGQDQRALGALVVPTWDALQDRGVVSDEFRNKVETLVEAQDIPALRALERELDTHGALYKALEAEVRERNMERLNYSGNDRISHIRVLLTPFTVENGMMTQTLKVKKNIVVDHFSEMIASMFQ